MKLLLAFEDEGAPIRVEISDGNGFIAIYETGTHIYLTLEALATIAEVTVQHLESVAPLFTEEDLKAGRRVIAKWSRLVEELGD